MRRFVFAHRARTAGVSFACLLAGLAPLAMAQDEGRRSMAASDLATLTDLGWPYGREGDRLFTVSPDGRSIAFLLQRADPTRNTYDISVNVMDTDGTAPPVKIDQGGQFIMRRSESGGFADFTPSGVSLNVLPIWSPDGRSVAYVRKDGGHVQVWIAQFDGDGSRAVTNVPFDVEQVAWLSDQMLAFSGRPGLEPAKQKILDQGRVGYVFDDRMIPLVSARPQLRGVIPRDTFVVDLKAAVSRPASAREASEVQWPSLSLASTVALAGGVVVLRPEGGAGNKPLVFKPKEGADVACDDDPCRDVSAVFPSADRQSVYFFHRHGVGRNRVSLYAWRPGRSVTQILDTTDMLAGCTALQQGIICAQEQAAQPRRLVLISPDTGRIRVLFDPNPQVQSLRRGAVERLTWTNRFGVETFGDLVLPPDHQPGQTHPLIVVTYVNRSFLRGGTGDEYPVFPLASAGFAVLTFNNPRSLNEYRKAKGLPPGPDLPFANWDEKENVLASLESGLDLAISKGVIDPERIGITGLSDGATTGIFALLNSRPFAAAALSNCCLEPTATAYNGPAVTDAMAGFGFPRVTENRPGYWERVSFRLNARTYRTPTLFQVSDNEYRYGLDGFAALKEQKRPVEMIVFPDEMHIKWQPAHRYAIYVRNIDWFRFWLRGAEDPDPAKVEQYARWRDLRDQAKALQTPSPAP